MPPRANTTRRLDATQLVGLSLNLTAHKTPATPETVAPIFYHLNQEKIPRRSTRSIPYSRDSAESKVVWNAVCALNVTVACSYTISGKFNPQLDRRFLRSDGWPSIWAWIMFLNDELVLKASYEQYIRDCCPQLIPQVLQVMGFSSVIRRAMIQTPGVVEFVTKKWMVEEQSPEDETMKKDGVRYPWLAALEQLIHPEKRPDEVNFRVLEASGWKYNEVAKLALGKLRALLAEKRADVALIGTAVNVVNYLSSTNAFEKLGSDPSPEYQDRLLYAFLVQGKIAAIVKAIAWCNKQPVENASFSDPTTRIVAFSYFSMVDDLNIMDSPVWLIQAMESGLFLAMLRSRKWVSALTTSDEQEETFSAALLSTIIPLYLLYPKVIRAARKAVKQVERLGLGTKETAGPLYGRWVGLKEIVEERARLLKQWENDVEFKGDQKFRRDYCERCSMSPAQDDGEGENTVELKRCTSCLNVFYCSKECQKAHWPRHKEDCKVRRTDMECGRRGMINKSERSFLEYIVREQVNQHKTAIADTVGSGPLLQYLVRVSLAHTPPQVTALRYNEAYPGPTKEVDWEAVLSDSEEGSDDDDVPDSQAGSDESEENQYSDDSGSMTSEDKMAFDKKFRNMLYLEFTVPGNEDPYSSSIDISSWGLPLDPL